MIARPTLRFLGPALFCAVVAAVVAITDDTRAADDFVNFESGHTRPLALSPDGTLLFAVNTPDARLSIFRVGTASLALAAEIQVGLEPIAVAARVNAATSTLEAWVVNHLSDSVSIVAIDTAEPERSRVVRTLLVGDEPRDVVFAGTSAGRAFITTARRGQNLPPSIAPRFVDEGIPRALVWVFAADAPGGGLGGTPLTILELFGDSPRALAASPDGATVYAAVFHSGNRTSVVAGEVVQSHGGPPPLPPGSPFIGEPLLNFMAVIVRYDPVTGEWNDEASRDWSPVLPFSLPDKDVFVIDADADPPALASGIDSYVGIGTTLFNLAVRPTTGSVFVSNTEARNHVRFEPLSAGGVQGHLAETRLTVLDGIAVQPVHVNPHVDYGVATGPASEIEESLAQLTDLTFSSDGATLFAAALGSNRVAAFDAAALESGAVVRDVVEVGRGPTGVVLDEERDQLYVMNLVDHTISIVTDAGNPALRVQSAVVAVGFDPTPAAVKSGRSFLYDARSSSGHGDASCASCHVFGDGDSLAWDLGDPFGAVIPNPNPGNFLFPVTQPFHPLKGPMGTQSLRGMAEGGPMHWRGDRTAAADPGGDFRDARGAFAKFNPAFVSLLGRSTELTTPEMDAFTDFAMSIRYPPNPVRRLDDSLSENEAAGFELFTARDNGSIQPNCTICHALPLGSNATTLGIIEIPHLRNLYQKLGRFGAEDAPFQGEQIRGFGLEHAGATGSLPEFVARFEFPGAGADQLMAFLLTFDTGLRPAVGQQVTRSAASASAATEARIALLTERAAAGDCDLTVAADIAGEPRSGWITAEGDVALDRSTDPVLDALGFAALASAPGAEQTYTCRPPGTGRRAALDHDGDGVANGDEADVGTDPFDPASAPLACGAGGALEGIVGSKLTITKNDAPSGNEGLSIKAAWTLAGSPTIDLVQNGMQVLLRDGSGAIVLHRRIVGAAVGKGPGWKVNTAGTKWSYKAKDLSGGIEKVSVVRKGSALKVQVKGKAGDFHVTTADVSLELVLGGDDQTSAGLCATRTFSGDGGCVLKPKVLKCG